MISFETALEKMKSLLQVMQTESGRGLTYVILEGQTIEKPYGWIFFYNTKEFLETGNYLFHLAGNAPILVLRNNGMVIKTSTHEPLDDFLNKVGQGFESGGDEHQ